MYFAGTLTVIYLNQLVIFDTLINNNCQYHLFKDYIGCHMDLGISITLCRFTSLVENHHLGQGSKWHGLLGQGMKIWPSCVHDHHCCPG